MPILSHPQITAIQGKTQEVWVKRTDNPFAEKVQVRGAQNFTPTEEKPETVITELGFPTSKAIYGHSSYSATATLTFRDLYELCQLVGLDPAQESGVHLDDFKPVNVLVYFKDDEGNVILTEYAGGWKARTASKAIATDAHSTVTCEGRVEYAASFEGKVDVIQYSGDGSTDTFDLPAGVSEEDVYMVEWPSGRKATKGTHWNYVEAGGATPSTPAIEMTSAPLRGDTIRIVYKIQ